MREVSRLFTSELVLAAYWYTSRPDFNLTAELLHRIAQLLLEWTSTSTV